MSPQKPSSPLFTQLMSETTRLYSTTLDRRLKAAGLKLSHSQWRVIVNLYREDGLFQSQIAERMTMEKAPLGTLLDKLESNGWITRQPDPKDRRMRRVFISDKGRTVFPLLEQEANRLRRECVTGLSPQQLEQLQSMLSLIRNNILQLRDDTDQPSSPEPAQP